jgi:hypothetical protein
VLKVFMDESGTHAGSDEAQRGPGESYSDVILAVAEGARA